MAFAQLVAEAVLGIKMLEHLNRSNSTLASGSQRRADLFGQDRTGNWHVIEAKSRTYGFTSDDEQLAKQQSLNVRTVLRNGLALTPATRSASLADLSTTPITLLLVDPEGRPTKEALYEIDVEEFIAIHYSVVPDLLEAQGGPQPAPDPVHQPGLVGAFLPGTDIWLGVHESLVGGSSKSWERRLGELDVSREDPAISSSDERVSEGSDGHVLYLGEELARTFEWPAESEPSQSGES